MGATAPSGSMIDRQITEMWCRNLYWDRPRLVMRVGCPVEVRDGEVEKAATHRIV